MKLVPKYQEGGKQDAIKSYKPVIPLSPIRRKYIPTQQPTITQDSRSGWDREVSKQIKADRAKNENLYKNQHTWNWSAPFNNTRTTKDNASAMFDFNKSSGISTFTTGIGIANPISTATSIAGSLVGAGIGNKIAGEKGALVGGLVGGLANPKMIKTASKRVSKKIDKEFANNQRLGIVAKPFQGESDITSKFLKFAGGRKREAPVDINKLRGAERLQALKLQEAGVDMSKVTQSHISSALGQREMLLKKYAPEGRFNIIKPNNIIESKQDVLDFYKTNGIEDRVGVTQLLTDKSGHVRIGGTDNISNNPSIHKVEERGLNSAIQLSNQSGLKGVITGEDLKSAPKTYNVWKHFKDKELVGNHGEHSNTNMISEAIKEGRLRATPDIDKEVTINNINQMIGTANRRLVLYDAPVYKLSKQSNLPTKTKSVLFNPTIIDKTGKMNIDWDNLDIFKVGMPIIGTNMISNGDR